MSLTPAQTVNAVAPYQGVIEWKGQPSQGVSQQTGNAWANVDFVLKYLNHNMREESIVFTLSGPDKVNELMAMPLGTLVKVSWRPTSRSWVDQQGQVKWFPQFSAFNVVPVPQDGQTAQPQYQGSMQQPGAQPYGQPQYGQYAPQQPAYQQAPTPAYQQAAPAPAPQPTQAPAPQRNPIDDLPFD